MTDFKVCVAESCTGGNIQAIISAHSGVSKWFAGGITAYNIDMKTEILKVPREIAEPCNCVSKEVAEYMAYGVRKLFGDATISISTTGYVSANDVEDKPFCYIHVSSVFGDYWGQYYPSNDKIMSRVQIQNAMTGAVICMLKTHYEEYRNEFRTTYDTKVLDHFESIIEKFVFYGDME